MRSCSSRPSERLLRALLRVRREQRRQRTRFARRWPRTRATPTSRRSSIRRRSSRTSPARCSCGLSSSTRWARNGSSPSTCGPRSSRCHSMRPSHSGAIVAATRPSSKRCCARIGVVRRWRPTSSSTSSRGVLSMSYSARSTRARRCGTSRARWMSRASRSASRLRIPATSRTSTGPTSRRLTALAAGSK